MSRITTVTDETATPEQKALFDAIQNSWVQYPIFLFIKKNTLFCILYGYSLLRMVSCTICQYRNKFILAERWLGGGACLNSALHGSRVPLLVGTCTCTSKY